MYIENKCWECKHKKDVIGNAHIKCSNPDTSMTGDSHGIKNGWFMYPFLFDPTWMTKKCSNFESLNPAVSNAIRPETSGQ